MELIWQHDECGGPVMIEAGARLPGAGLPSLYSRVYNPDLLSATVCATIGKPITSATPSISKRERFGRIVCLISEAEHGFVGLKEGDLKKNCVCLSLTAGISFILRSTTVWLGL